MARTVVKRSVSKTPGLGRDHAQEWAWIAAHGHAYRGQWVMVRHNTLLAADPNIRALLSRVPPETAADAIVWYLETDEEQLTAVV
jgi:hypothetical protein